MSRLIRLAAEFVLVVLAFGAALAALLVLGATITPT